MMEKNTVTKIESNSDVRQTPMSFSMPLAREIGLMEALLVHKLNFFRLKNLEGFKLLLRDNKFDAAISITQSAVYKFLPAVLDEDGGIKVFKSLIKQSLLVKVSAEDLADLYKGEYSDKLYSFSPKLIGKLNELDFEPDLSVSTALIPLLGLKAAIVLTVLFTTDYVDPEEIKSEFKLTVRKFVSNCPFKINRPQLYSIFNDIVKLGLMSYKIIKGSGVFVKLTQDTFFSKNVLNLLPDYDYYKDIKEMVGVSIAALKYHIPLREKKYSLYEFKCIYETLTSFGADLQEFYHIIEENKSYFC